MESIRGDVVTKQMKARIRIVEGDRGGIEFHAPTYSETIIQSLLERDIIDRRHYEAACDYLELKKAVYGFLDVNTMQSIFKTGDTSPRKDNAESCYYIAAKYIGRNNDRLINRAMNEEADSTLTLEMVFNAYRTAFHYAFDGMDLAISEMRNLTKKELAC